MVMTIDITAGIILVIYTLCLFFTGYLFGRRTKAEVRARFIPTIDYETRLKAEKVAMLEELKEEFAEYEPKWAENEEQAVAANRTWDDFDDIIQQKIDKLKENKDEKK